MSGHALDLIENQYSFAASLPPYKCHGLHSGVTLVQYSHGTDRSAFPSNEYSIDTRTWTCSCMFMVTRFMLCRYVLFIRTPRYPDQVVPIRHIHSRWRLDRLRQFRIIRVSNDTSSASTMRIRRTANQLPALDVASKFNNLLVISRQIADIGSRFGTQRYETLRDSLEACLTALKGDLSPTVVMPSIPSDTRLKEYFTRVPSTHPVLENPTLKCFTYLPEYQRGQTTHRSESHISMMKNLLSANE